MRYESLAQIDSFLRSNRWFEECLLTDVRWKHYGTVLELVFDFTWLSDGTIRPDYLGPDVRTFELHNVLDLHLQNRLTEQMVLNPAELGWGMSEVARVEIEHLAIGADGYAHLPVTVHQLRVLWEGGRSLRIHFSSLETK